MPLRLDRVQQTGFDFLDQFANTGDPSSLRAAADAWRWVAQMTRDPAQRSFVVAAISVAMRRYYDATKELWALREAVDAGRFAVGAEQDSGRWLSACIYLAVAEYTYFDALGERPYLDDAVAVLRTAGQRSLGHESRSSILSHLVAALQKTYNADQKQEILEEMVYVGREAARLPGPLQIDSIVDVMANLGELSYIRDDVEILLEAEALGRWALTFTELIPRGRVLFSLAKTLDGIGGQTGNPAVVADALAAGEMAVALSSDGIEAHLRGLVVDGIRNKLRKMQPPPVFPLPPV
jgi:hypothetical protein